MTLQQYRHHLHSIPELYFQEHKTSIFIAKTLTDFGLDYVHTGIIKTGVIGILKSGKSDLPNIAIRAEMDGLPICEKSQLKYKSTHEGLMHACGHDGHMAIVLGIAKYFSQHRNEFQGTLYFLFTPAEEEGAGCQYLLEDPIFQSLNIQEVYALHNWPEFKVGQIGIAEGAIMSGDNEFTVTIIGKGGHAAMPQNSINPLLYINQITSDIEKIQIEFSNQVVLTPTQILCDNAINVIPNEISIKGTFRYSSIETEKKIIDKLNCLGNNINNKISVKTTVKHGYIPTINDIQCAKFCKKIVQNKMPSCKLIDVQKPSMASEDFGYLLQNIKGCYVWLGSNSPLTPHKLHTNKFNFNDQLLDIGFKYFQQIIFEKLKPKIQPKIHPKIQPKQRKIEPFAPFPPFALFRRTL